MKPILILGGYGGTGQKVAQLLAKKTNRPLIIAGRDIEKANLFAHELNKEFKTDRISALFADATKPETLTKAFRGIQMVIVASTTAEYAPNVVRAALELEADYLDYHFNEHILSLLEPFKDTIKKAGRIFITQAGFHPGLPATVARAAAPHFDQYKKAIIGMAMNAKFESVESSYELVDAIGDYRANIFVDSKWRLANFKDVRTMDFGHIFGIQQCFPIQMNEIKKLPEMLGLEEVVVCAAGFNWFTNYITTPLIILFYKIKKGLARHTLARLLVWGTKIFPSKKVGVAFVLNAEGIKDKKSRQVRLLIEAKEPYLFTAIPIVACILQYLDGTLSKPGLAMMGHIVDPKKLLDDMKDMGVHIQWTF